MFIAFVAGGEQVELAAVAALLIGIFYATSAVVPPTSWSRFMRVSVSAVAFGIGMALAFTYVLGNGQPDVNFVLLLCGGILLGGLLRWKLYFLESDAAELKGAWRTYRKLRCSRPQAEQDA